MSEEQKPAESKRGALRPWPKGVSGNPGGRKRKSEQDRQVEALARKSSAEALEVVTALMKSADTDRTRLAAALAVIERAHGKPGDRLSEPLTLPESATLAQQGEAVMQAACEGRITPAQASALLAGLGAVARLVETTELQARIEALEARK